MAKTKASLSHNQPGSMKLSAFSWLKFFRGFFAQIPRATDSTGVSLCKLCLSPRRLSCMAVLKIPALCHGRSHL